MATHRKVLQIPTVARIGMLAAGLLCFYGAARYMQALPIGFRSFAPGYLFIQIGCLLLLLGTYDLHEPTGMLKKPFRAAVWLGRISYGLYVIHIFALHGVEHAFARARQTQAPPTIFSLLAQVLVALVLTVFLSALSYRFIERPFLQLKERFTVIRSRPG